MAIKIVADSTCYLSEEMKRKFDIRIVSLNVIIGNESLREVDIDNTTFYSEMEKRGEIPTSSQPSIEEMYNEFERIASNGDDIVAICLSSDMSGTYSSSHIVKNMILEKYPDTNIQIIDSRSNCMQMGFQAIEGAKLAMQGKSMEEVVDRINFVKEHSQFIFLPDTLSYLKKGGRIGGAAALVGSILQIKPILTVVDGKTTVFDKVRTKKRAVDTIVSHLEDVSKERKIGDVIVHHINVEDEGRELAEKIKSRLGITPDILPIGPVIGLHVGPGSIGIAYYTEK